MQKNKKITKKVSIDDAERIIKRVVARKGYQLLEIKSESTISRYYKISSGPYELAFRISDHSTKKRLMTLRIDHNFSIENIERFAINRCKDLGDRIVKQTLGVI